MSKNGENSDEKGKIFQDPRFSHLVSDPRFKQLPRKERKVKIDKRFQSMFHDEKFKLKYTVDKYGRKVNKTSSEDLKKYYDIGSSDEDEEKEKRLEEIEIAKESGDDENTGTNDDLNDDGEVLPSDVKQKLLNSKIDYARGEGRLFTDSSEDEESSEDENEVFIEHVWGELDNDAPRTEESTRRLAACNMDWDRIRASDIMVLCNSFLPPGGFIVSVTIYPSEFGKQRLAEEDTHGPPELKKQDEDSDSNSDDDDLVKEQDSEAEEGDEYHMEKLRQYQLNRLKYYYAVIECDSVATADKLYKECDGLEYESTATKLDLRFISDDINFDDDEPKEVCKELPDLTKYKPRLFSTSALYQAKVDLTWDETSVERRELNEKLATGKLNEVTDVELRNFVAYSSEEENETKQREIDNEDKSSSEEDEEDKPKDSIEKYKSLLEEINNKEIESKKNKFEMEYTWGINVQDKLKEKSDIEKKNLTPFDKILEKKHEKNKRRKEERKKNKRGSEADCSSDDIPDGVDLSDPYFADEFANGDFEPPTKSKSKKKESKKSQDHDKSEEEQQNAKELELLLDDGEDDRNHFSLDKIQKAESETKTKRKRRKLLKKSKKEIEASKAAVEDNFEVNLNDERFGALYKSHLFNIDPTNPQFKKTKGMEKIIHEKLKRRHNDEKVEEEGESDTKKPKTHLETRILVKNLKRKIQGK